MSQCKDELDGNELFRYAIHSIWKLLTITTPKGTFLLLTNAEIVKKLSGKNTTKRTVINASCIK